MASHRLFLGILAVFFTRPELALAAEKKEIASTFIAVVHEHFDHWAQDNVLSAVRIKNLIIQKNPRIRGDAAAALVAIHNYQLGHNGNAVTKEFLLRSPRSNKAEANLEDDFRDARDRIATASRQIFVGQAPTLGAIKQGETGDCFFLAPVGAAISSNPQRIRRLFDVHEDGSFDVIFSEQRKEHFAPLTDAQIGLIDDYDERADGLWLAGLKLAMGRQIKKAPHTPGEQPKKKPISPAEGLIRAARRPTSWRNLPVIM